MVVFKKVTINNFMAIEEAVLELDSRGLVLIEGENKSNESYVSNGSSKTTLLSSITYALYGKTEKGIKADDVVNNKYKKNTSVVLEFMIAEDLYRIERYRKDKVNKNKVTLFCNDKEITGSTNDVTDQQIQDLFKIDYNTYLNAIMYGQGDVPMFSQATDKGKKEILESVTGVAVYQKAQEVAKEKVKEVASQQQEIERDIQTKEMEKQNIRNIFDSKLADYQNTMDAVNTKVEQLKYEQEQYNNLNQTIDSRVQELEAQKQEVPSSEFTYSQDYHSAKGKLDQVVTIEQDQSQKYYQCSSEIKMLEQNKNNLSINKNCPVCGSELDTSHKEKELQSIEEQLSSLSVTIGTISSQMDKIKQAKDKLEGIIKEEDDKAYQNSNNILTIKGNNDKIDLEIQRTKEQLTQKEHQLSLMQNTIDSMSSVPKPSLDNESIEEIEDLIKSLQKDILELEDKKTYYSQAVEAFSNKGIRSVILDFVTPFLNEKANKYLTILSGSDIEVKFQTQVENAKGELKDKFDVTVMNKNGGQSYKANSAGEQKRIDLAISFAIQDLIMDKNDLATNIALYDECFDGLDIIGCENVITLLKDRLKTVPTIFVITHNTHLAPLFENSIKVVKENGIARLKN